MPSIVLKDVRLSFPNLSTPRAFNESEEASYSATLVMDKDDQNTDANIKAIEKAIDDAIADYQEKGGKFTRALIKNHPIKDGDVVVNRETGETNEANHGKFYVIAKTKNKPRCVDVMRQDFVTDEALHEALYPGAYAHVQLHVYIYENKFGKGLSYKLGAVKESEKVGERFGGAPASVDEIFEGM